MNISQEKLQTAKQEAVEYLEYSIYTLSIMLGVDPEIIDDSWIQSTEILLNENEQSGVNASGVDHDAALRCLVQQVKAYAKIAPV